MSQAPAQSGRRHRVVVVGGGFGGLPATRLLAHSPVDVTLIDRRNHHLFQPLLYQVATGILSPGRSPRCCGTSCAGTGNVQVELAEVTGFDLERRVVIAAAIPPRSASTLRQPDRRGRRGPVLLRARRVRADRPGHEDASTTRSSCGAACTARSSWPRASGTSPRSAYWLTIVIVGGGPDRRRARRADPRAGGAQPDEGLPQHRPGVRPGRARGRRRRAARHLRRPALRHGRPTRWRSAASSCDAHAASSAWTPSASTSTGRTARSGSTPGTVIWAAGVQASPLAGCSPRPPVRDGPGRTHRRPARPHPARPSRGVRRRRHGDDRQAAGRRARSRCRAACTPRTRSGAGSNGDARDVPFRYRDLGSAAAIGRFSAIVSFRGVRLSGFPGCFVWLFVHLAFLNGFGNRFTALWRWARAMVGRARPERVFSMGHTGGDLSLPDEVRRRVMPSAFPGLRRRFRSSPTRRASTRCRSRAQARPDDVRPFSPRTES